MRLFKYLPILFFIFISNCYHSEIRYVDNNKFETSSIVTVKPKIVKESAFENFYISEKLENELKKIQFSSTSYLRSNKDCVGIIRLTVSGSIDYYQLISTLKKRAHDIGGNAIGVYDYKEKRRVYVKQHGYEVFTEDLINRILKPKMEYVLVKENQKVASITADVFKCRKST